VRGGAAASDDRCHLPVVLVAVAANVAILSWLDVLALLAVEFTISAFTNLTASIIRSTCCDPRKPLGNT
jgi:hypothetical protein